MGVYRTYFDKNNTIVKDSLINTGRNQVSELYFGGKKSRFLFFCSFDEIKNKVNNKEIIIENGVKHYLKIKSTSNFDVSPFLSENNNLLFSDKYRSSSFDLELRPIEEFWDEGFGYDFELNPLSLPQNRDFSEEPSNWFNKTYAEDFLIPGGVLGEQIAKQHFDLGNEDVYMDITDFVNNIITSGVTTGITEVCFTGTTTGSTTCVTGITGNYFGFCLKYTDEYENIEFEDDKSFIYGLFTRHTQTFFEPFIETVYDDQIRDDREHFYLDKINRLYFYVNVDGKLQNLDKLPIFNIEGVVFVNQPIVKQQSKGVYYVEFFADSNTFDSFVEYKDIWSNIKINGINRPNVKLRFVTKNYQDYYQLGSSIADNQRYGVSLSGIKREEKIKQGEVKKVNVHVRKEFTVSENDVISNVFYNLYIKQGANVVQILDWQPINKSNINFFTIDTTWLIPQVYFVDIKIEQNGEVIIYNEELKFSIINKFL
jgi:hypothetical protein